MIETVEDKIKINPAWSEEFRRGYNNGYSSAERHYNLMLKEKLAAKDRERVNLLRVFPYNLISMINGEDDDSYLRTNADEDRQDQRKYYSIGILEDVMAKCLSERENKVLQMRYEWGMTLEEAGKECGVTRERIRQVEVKALRKLRNPIRIQAMRAIPFEEYKQVCAENAQLKKQVEILTYQLNEKNNTNLSSNEIIAKVPVEIRPLEELDLSIRSYNCLKRASCNTVGDVKKLIDEGTLERVRNLGKKSYMEVVEKINEVCK